MKLKVETEKPVKLKMQEQESLSLTQGMTIQPMPAIQIGTVETLPEGSEATASFSGDPRTPELNLGIPVGATGARGADGSDGESAGFGTPTVTVTDLEHGDPATVSITASGPDTAKVFAFSFGIPAGPRGEAGPSGGQGPQGPKGDDYNLTQADRTEIAGIVETDIQPTLDAKQAKIYVTTDGGETHLVTGITEMEIDDVHGFLLQWDGGSSFFADGIGLSTVLYGVNLAIAGKQDAGDYAAAAAGDTDHAAIRAASIPFGKVDGTSTSTAYTATVPGITSLHDGVCCYLMNGVVTSAAGFTINVNNLGALPVYSTLSAASQASTLFNVNYTLLFVYNSKRVAGGCWDAYYGYDSNTNTIGYQLRTNSQSMPMQSVTYRYRLLFTSKDGTKFVPANNSTSTNATATRTVCQDPIDPHGPIYYYGTTASVAAGSRPSTSYLWQQYVCTLGYSFNRTGAALTLTSWKPVYVVCNPQTDGSAIIDSSTPYVQALPTTEDGKIYIHLGTAVSATTVEILMNHTVYYYKDNAIRRWNGPDA